MIMRLVLLLLFIGLVWGDCIDGEVKCYELNSNSKQVSIGRQSGMYNEDDVFIMHRQEEYFLPKQNVSSKYIFAKEDMYFVYQNNYNQFVNLYKNTYQHGGISMEEMLIPIIILRTK